MKKRILIVLGLMAPLALVVILVLPGGSEHQDEKRRDNVTVAKPLSPALREAIERHFETPPEPEVGKPASNDDAQQSDQSPPAETSASKQKIDAMREISTLDTVEEKTNKIIDFLLRLHRKELSPFDIDRDSIREAIASIGLDALPHLMKYFEVGRSGSDEEAELMKDDLGNDWLNVLSKTETPASLRAYFEKLSMPIARKAEWIILLKNWYARELIWDISSDEQYAPAMIDLIFHPNPDLAERAVDYAENFGPKWIIPNLDKFEKVFMERDLGADALMSVADQDLRAKAIFIKYLRRPEAHRDIKAECNTLKALLHLAKLDQGGDVLPYVMAAYRSVPQDILSMQPESYPYYHKTVEEAYRAIVAQLEQTKSGK